MTSFAITLYGQCCRLRVVGQQVVSDSNVIRSCWNICSLRFEPVTAPEHLCTWNVYFASNTKHSLPYNTVACSWWPWIQNIMTSLLFIYVVDSEHRNVRIFKGHSRSPTMMSIVEPVRHPVNPFKPSGVKWLYFSVHSHPF